MISGHESWKGAQLTAGVTIVPELNPVSGLRTAGRIDHAGTNVRGVKNVILRSRGVVSVSMKGVENRGESYEKLLRKNRKEAATSSDGDKRQTLDTYSKYNC